MNIEYTDLELQLWLAGRLQEYIEPAEDDELAGTYYWAHSGDEVTHREWLHVVSLVEEKLSPNEHHEFRKRLWELTDQSQDCSWSGVNGEEHNRRYISSSWQLRTIALSQTLNIPIR